MNTENQKSKEMKNSKIFVIILTCIIAVSCATVRQPIPVSPKPILTGEEIMALEKEEEKLAEEKFQLIASENKSGSIEQPLVSNIFVEMDIRAVLMDLATQTGINIIPDNSVEGSVSLILNEVPLETAFDMILYPGGYKYRFVKEGKYYIVGRSLPENTSFDALAITKTIKTNRDAVSVISQLSPHFQSFAKAEGQVITITASPEMVNRIERDIASIDKSKRQIEISAQFVMVEWEKGTNLGMKWGDLNLSGLGMGNFIFEGGGRVLTGDLTSELSSALSANGYDVKIETMAEPRIIVEDGEQAELNITEEHLFLILSGGGAAYNYFTTKEVSVGIKLKVQPFVTRDGKIRLDINPEVADIVGERDFKSNGGPSQSLPIIARRSSQTMLKVENGETIAIGGLITKVEKSNKSGIPGLRNIPLIGIAFGNKGKQSKETELVIFITSKVIG